jgi:choline dehydrogenase-like flavoprotein
LHTVPGRTRVGARPRRAVGEEGENQEPGPVRSRAEGPGPILTPWERRLSVVLRITAGGLFLAALIYALGPIVTAGDLPGQDFFRQPVFVSNSVVKVTILGLACLYASGDVRRRRYLVVIVILAHVVSVAAMASMLTFAETGTPADLGYASPTIETVLLYSIGLDALITAGIAIFLFLAWRSARGLPERDPPADVDGLSPPEVALRTLLLAFSALFILGALAYETLPFLNSTSCSTDAYTRECFAIELPFVTNSVVKVAAMAMLCLYARAHLRGNMSLVGPVIAVHFLSVAVQLLYLWKLETDYTVELLGTQVEMSSMLWGGVVLDGSIALLFLVVYLAAWRGRYRLSFLQPMPYRALIAAADSLVSDRDYRVPPAEIAMRVEGFLRDFRARRRWFYRIALSGIQLLPLATLRAPFSQLDRQTRREFLEKRFERGVGQTRQRLIKHAKQVTVRIAQQLVYASYYGDARSYAVTSYEPFSERGIETPEVGEHPLDVKRPAEIDVAELEAEVCVIGSGAAGAVLAHELAARGCDVLILERGQYVEPQHFNEDEVDMISRLYADGIMQQTEDWRFSVLQGSCVGGSTTVNNAVCFDPPPDVLEEWNDPQGADAGLDLDRLVASVGAVRKLIGIESQIGTRLNPSGHLFVEGAEGLGLVPDQLEVGVVEANIHDCPGSGYCNMGCKWGRKLSMLDSVLPRAQRRFPGKVRIVAECEVERILTLSGDPKRVNSLWARLGDGRGISIRAGKYVLAAGAVASSYLLIRSAAARGLPVGQRFSANMGAPLTAEFDGEPLKAFEGLQISHYGVPQPRSGPPYVFETWFNPPVAQALNMPGWFERHFDNMSRYDHLMAVGALVGTASNGRVGRALLGGPGVTFTPQPQDLATLATALSQLSDILFEAGAKRVMLNTWSGKDDFTRSSSASGRHARIAEICSDPDYIALGTGHPQGGNSISSNPQRGVVDSDFRVHGYQDLYVCDASVFPTSLTVNPQLTVMALAHYAASRIASA